VVCEATETANLVAVETVARQGRRKQKQKKGDALRAWMCLPFLAVACASSHMPAEKMASAEAAVRAAREVGAENVPQAELHVKLAQDQIAKARRLIDSGDNDRAAWMLRRADADAELALALAREASTRTEAQRAIDEQNALQQGRKPPVQ
jgi:hypothetical protein